MAQYFTKREEERREMRQLVETIMQGHHSASEARSKLQKMKRKIGRCNDIITGDACTVHIINCYGLHLFHA